VEHDIYDVNSYKTNPYPWRIILHNDQKTTPPLRHVVIQDRKIIAENGETVLKGLDEALKFVRLESDRTFSKLGDGQTFADKEMGYDENNICRIQSTTKQH